MLDKSLDTNQDNLGIVESVVSLNDTKCKNLVELAL